MRFVALDASGDEDVVGLAVVAFLNAIEGAIDCIGRKPVLKRPLADGFALLFEQVFEGLDGHVGPPVGFKGTAAQSLCR